MDHVVHSPRSPVSRRSSRSVPRWPSIPRPSSRPPGPVEQPPLRGPGTGHRGHRGLPRSVPKNQQKMWKIDENPPFLLGFPWFLPFSMGFLCVFYGSLVCVGFPWCSIESCCFFTSRLAFQHSPPDHPSMTMCQCVLSRLLPQAQKQVTLHHRDLRVVPDLRLKGLHHANHRVACSRAIFFRGSQTGVMSVHIWMAMLGNFHFLDKPGWVKHLEIIWGRRNIRWQ